MDLLGRFASWKGQTESVKLQVALIRAMIRMNELRVLLEK
jgi:hypothetical protein